MNKQNLVVLEGISGVGKTTIANELSNKYGWLHIPEVIDTHGIKKFTEEYFIFAEEAKIIKYINSKVDKIVMDRSPISIMAHNFVRKQLKQENHYDLLIAWFQEVMKPINSQKFVYLRTDDYGKCLKRKWGRKNLERFPQEFLAIEGMKLWTRNEALYIFQKYYDNFFKNKEYKLKIIDSNNHVNEIVNQIIKFYGE